ncbi:MAG TPA: hypothetical protein VIH35_02560 [Kiritimatiellia bacterium]|jgi:hypothetical protein
MFAGFIVVGAWLAAFVAGYFTARLHCKALWSRLLMGAVYAGAYIMALTLTLLGVLYGACLMMS